MKKILLIIGTLFVTSIFLSGCTETDAESWTWELLASGTGRTMITFTQQQISCCDSDSPEDVFESITGYIINVYEDGTWDVWDIDLPQSGSLKTVEPGVIYHTKVTQDCTLTINKC